MSINKFRGKSIKTGKWIYGVPIPNGYGERVYIVGLILNDKVAYPMERLHEFCHEVIPETVSQYTGLKDKNGVEIYDKTRVCDDKYQVYGTVEFSNGKFTYKWGNENIFEDLFVVAENIEVLSNQ